MPDPNDLPTIDPEELETLKADFRQEIINRSEIVPATQRLHLVDVTVDTPDVLVRDMNQEGFTEYEWRVETPVRYPQIDEGTYDIYGTIPTVCARLDFQADSLDLRRAFSLGVTVCDKLRLKYLVLNHLDPERPMKGKVAQQIHYGANQRIIGAIILVQILDTDHRSKTYGRLYDRIYPEGFWIDRHHVVDGVTYQIIEPA